MRAALKLFALVAASMLLAACASPRPVDPDLDYNDPFEGMNRGIFQMSLVLDKAVVRPIALGYRFMMPPPVRQGVRNFLDNLKSPVILTNDLLQGEMERAGTTIIRASLNSTLGIGGIFEVAEEWGFVRHSEDFGQTLAVWGVGEGPFLVIPLIGPGNPRDLIGRLVDITFDPLSYVQWGDEYYVPIARFTVDTVDLRERNIETLDDIERSSADFYASVRSLYRQSRDNAIANGLVDVEDLPDF